MAAKKQKRVFTFAEELLTENKVRELGKVFGGVRIIEVEIVNRFSLKHDADGKAVIPEAK